MKRDFDKIIPGFRLAKKSHILHKLEMGILFDIFYDTETTDLSKRFAEITEFGGVITDLAGNILHTVDLRAKVSPYTVISPFAWLVQRMRLDNVLKGDPRSIFMGKVKQFFDYGSHLYKSPYINKFTAMCKEGTYSGPSGEKEKYFAYPVLNDDGSIDYDFIRIHHNLKKLYFKDITTGQWVKRDIKAMAIGYNNVNADDQWLWTEAHMAAADNIFFTHLSQNGKFRLDMLRVVEAVYAAGQAGENSLKVPLKENNITGETAVSFSLGAIIKSNTRLSSEIRGILDGIEMADGSQVDISQLHGALSDALALSALTQYIRQVHPDILACMEKNSNWKYVIDKLSEVNGNFGNFPPVAYVDKNFPTVEGKFVSLIGTDQHRNAPKVAVVWNLAIDPKKYTFNGKTVDGLSVADWKEVLIDGQKNPNSPLKVIKAHKSPRILTPEIGYDAGFNLGETRASLHSRVRYIKQSRLEHKIMQALRLAYPRLTGPDRLVLPQPEEELFTFSTLELFDAEHGEDVQIHHRINNKVEEIAQKSREHIMRVKGLWLSAAFFDEPIFTNDDGNVSQLLNKVKEINKKLSKLNAPLIPDPDGDIITKDDALKYKIKILFFARNYFAQGILKDIGHNFWFEDKDGIRHKDIDVRSWPPFRVDEALRSGNLRIRHEEIYSTPLVLDRIIEELGYAHLLGEDINRQLQAYKGLRCQGIPHYEGVGDRWYTIHAARKDLAKIENNEILKEDILSLDGYMPGAWQDFMDKFHESHASIQEYKKYLKTVEGRTLPRSLMPYVGIDPTTRYPLKNYEYPIRKADSIIVDVPDRYIDKPSIDPVTNRPVWIVPISGEFNKSAKLDGASVLMRGKAARRIYHLANAKVTKVPERSEIYSEFYKSVQNSYWESGEEMPSMDRLVAVIGNGPHPVFNWRKMPHIQSSLLVPRNHFEAMIAPKLAGYQSAPRGLLIKDDHFSPQKGAVLLRETYEGVATGWQMDARITGYKEVFLTDIEKMDPKELATYGFSSMDEAVEYFSGLFTKFKKNPREKENKQNRAWAIALAQISPDSPERGMMFYKPDMQVLSCVV